MPSETTKVSKSAEPVRRETASAPIAEAQRNLVPFYQDPLAPIIFGGIAAATAVLIIYANYLR
jgi:hypothetical protein